MENTVVTKLVAAVNDNSLPLFGAIRIKRGLGANLFKLYGNTSSNVNVEVTSPDGTLQYSSNPAASTITVPVRQSLNRNVNFIDDTELAVIHNTADVGGIESCIILNELELANAPIFRLVCNGEFHLSNLPSSLTHVALGNSQADRGNVYGDISELKGVNFTTFTLFAHAETVTGNLSDIVEKFNPTGFRSLGLDGSLVQGDISLLKDLIANSTYDSGSFSYSSQIIYFRRSRNITGSLDDMLTYLTGKVISKRVGFYLSGSLCTYQGEACPNIMAVFDENGIPTVTPV